MKKLFLIILLIAAVLFGFYFGKREEAIPDLTPVEEAVRVEGLEIEHESEFGGVYIRMSIDEFNALGFEYGDSVDIVFSNGYELRDIPYYNGYYVDAGKPLLIAYPGYEYIKAAVNYGDDLWDTAELKMGETHEHENCLYDDAELEEHDSASIFLFEKAKYRKIQEARDISYFDEREKYDSDEIFANFRNIHMGEIKEGIIYRSASPCDDQHKRATYVNDLIKEAGINCILNLADNEIKIERYINADGFSCDYFLSLYNDGKVIPLALNMNYMSDEFASKIADGFIRMTQTDGPYLIHCTEGKDRTGFVCMLVEALAKADYESIKDDYMLTYDNYYRINEEKDPEKYQTILESNLDAMVKFIVNDDSVDFKNTDLSSYARAYLIQAGMSDEQIDVFLNKIS